jgi:hypothetical protein
MPRWLPSVLRRIRDLASRRQVRFTLKAQRELARLGFDGEDGRDILLRLTARDAVGRLVSEGTGEWLYVFKPRLTGTLVYLKLALRTDCVIISLHEDSGGSDEENS